MKEEIEAILKDESYTDEKERVNAIAKVIPLYTVPKRNIMICLKGFKM